MRTPFRIVFLLTPLLAAAAGCNARTPASQADAHGMPDMPDMADHAARPAKANKPDKSTTDKTAAAKVVIDNFTFDPPMLTVPVGTEVVWVNHDDVPHTATSTAKPKAFDSGTLDTDQTYSHVFKEAGEYEYFCAVHPKMTGKIIVK